MTALDVRDDWHRIEHVLHDRYAALSMPYVPPPAAAPIDPRTMAARLDALARDYDEDAKDARQTAAACRAYARELRAGRMLDG